MKTLREMAMAAAVAEPIILRFTAKIGRDGSFNRPEFQPHHATAARLQREPRFRAAMWRKLRKEGAVLPPRQMNANKLPENVTHLQGEFMGTFEVVL